MRKKELYKCDSRIIVLIGLWELSPWQDFFFVFFAPKEKEEKKKKENICCFNCLKIPDAISCNTGSGWIVPEEVGVSSCLCCPDR